MRWNSSIIFAPRKKRIPAKSRSLLRLWSCSVSLGDTHTCAITTLGALYCFGNNNYGQIGNGSNNNIVSTPSNVLNDVSEVSLGLSHTCAVKTNGDLYCFGINNAGQVGVDSENSRITEPTYITDYIYKISLSHFWGASKGHSCAGRSPRRERCRDNSLPRSRRRRKRR